MHVMGKFWVAAGCAALTLSVAGAAGAAATVETTNFIGAPTNFNGFEGSNGSDLSDNSYTEDNIKVDYVGSAFIVNTVGAPEGVYSWYPNGGGTGYTRITLADGGAFSAVQFLTGSGLGGPDSTLSFDVLFHGVSLLTGTAGPVPSYAGSAASGFAYYGFSGDIFDEVRLQVRNTGSGFDAGAFEAGIFDAIAIRGAGGGAVPEPASWALMIAGFGLSGAVLRRRRTTLA
jgi:hypothetical protein